jgi:hypothetical protein
MDAVHCRRCRWSSMEAMTLCCGASGISSRLATSKVPAVAHYAKQ